MASAASALVAYAGSSSDDDEPPPKRRTAPAAASGASSGQAARQTSISGFFRLPQPTPQQQKAKQKRDETRNREALETMANPTAPERAAHIDKTRVIRSNRAERDKWQREEEEDEEEDEDGEEEEEDLEKRWQKQREREERNDARKKKRRGPKQGFHVTSGRCKTVTAVDRVKEFPNQTLIAENGKLFCEACSRKPLAKIKSTVKKHVNGRKHMEAVKKHQKSKKLQQASMDVFREHSASVGGAYGSTLTPKEVTQQILFTKGCLSAGVPLNALNNPTMKDALHFAGVKLPSANHLANYIPVILKEELGDGTYTVCFDGTPYRCECFGIGIRFIGPDGQICQRLLGLSMLANSMDYKAIFGELNKVVFMEYKLRPERCRGFMLDGCSPNLKALVALTTHCANSVGIRCASHLLNLSGNQMESSQIDKFAGALQTVLSHSHNAADQWRKATGTTPPKAPNHRWGSAYERNNLLVTNWQQMKTFIDDFSSSDETRSRKADFCRRELARFGKHGYHQEVWLQIEFAVAVDLGKHLTNGTYLLEGDGMLLPVAYEVILRVRAGLALTRMADGSFDRPHLPNVDALIREYTKGDAAMAAKLEDQVRHDILPVQTYTWERIGDHPDAQQHETIAIFEAARLLDFRYVKQHQLHVADIDLLCRFPFVTENDVARLKDQMDDYNIAASGVDTGYDLWSFWHDNRHKSSLCHWYGVAKDIVLLQPSSAFMERVFSILRACMDARQEKSFSDRVAASALLKYNRGRGK
ncbi:unnamed protein product [Ectocarpus sp. CCAP 1310/34]|nr:unnamed protein product [Ectocarpus sp. CCAP 1310/34]